MALILLRKYKEKNSISFEAKKLYISCPSCTRSEKTDELTEGFGTASRVAASSSPARTVG